MKAMDRLGVKLAAAFAAVSLIGVAVVAAFAGVATEHNFNRYVADIRAGGMHGMGMTADAMAAMMGAPRQQFLSDLRTSLLFAALVAVGVAVVLGVVLAQTMTGPLRRLTLVAHRVAAGDLAQRVPVTGGDEIADLGTAFNTMAAALARAQEERQDLVADIAHELRTPLAVLQSHVEAMQDGLVPADAEHLATLHEETALLSRLVEDLRVLSLADAGRLELRREPLDLVAVARATLEESASLAAGRGVTLRLEDGGAALPVLADAGRLRQVLHNLLSNALRFAPAGTDVTVSLRREDSRGVCTVADQGLGIPSEDLPRVFERFYRADRSRARATGGSGLGLAIVRRLVEAHGGTIVAESPPGQGARFTFRLPLAAGAGEGFD